MVAKKTSRVTELDMSAAEVDPAFTKGRTRHCPSRDGSKAPDLLEGGSVQQPRPQWQDRRLELHATVGSVSLFRVTGGLEA